MKHKAEDFFVHETSAVEEPCQIGKGTKIWHFSHIMSGAVIGEECSIGQNVNIAGGAVIGNRVKIQNNVSVYDKVVLEDDVFCGPSCVFTNVINPRSHVPRRHEFRLTLVKQGATVGANATIICGGTIGRKTTLSFFFVVTKNVPDYALVYGNPAKVCGYVNESGEITERV